MLAPLKDKTLSVKVYSLIVIRIFIKLILIVFAFVLGAGYTSIIILLAIIFISELYKNLGYIAIRKYGNEKLIGAFISALDGATLVFALFFANALLNDSYLFIILSITLNTVEYGLISAMAEGIVAGFSYAIFILGMFGTSNAQTLFTIYILRTVFIVFLGWLTGWLSTELLEKESRLKLVLENDIHEEQLNEMKDSFVTDSAEALRTPISAIKGYIDIMLNGRVGELNDKARTFLESILRNIIKIDSEVDELLHIIEIEDDFITLKKKNINVNEFVTLIHEDLKAFSKVYKNNFKLKKFLLNKDSQITVDVYRLKIALKNIFSYIFDVSQDDIFVYVSAKEEGIDIIIETKVDNITSIKLLLLDEDSSLINKKSSMLKVYTSRIIIESHGGKISANVDDDKNLQLNINIPYNN